MVRTELHKLVVRYKSSAIVLEAFFATNFVTMYDGISLFSRPY